MKKIHIIIFLILSSYLMSVAQDNSELTLNIGKFNPNISNFPPFYINSLEEKEFSDLIFSRLITKTKDNQLNNDLLRNISRSNDLEWIIILKSPVLFHDGSLLTSNDVKYSIELFKILQNEQNIFYDRNINKISEIEIIGDATLIVRLSSDVQNFEELLSKIPIIPKKVYEKDSQPKTIEFIKNGHPVGSGPFKLESIDPGKFITLSSFKNYHGTVPEIDKININFYDSYDRIIQDFYLGNLDYFEVPNHLIAKELTKSGGKNFRVFKRNRDIKIFYFLAINSENPLFKDKSIRYSINHCINRAEILQNIVDITQFQNIEEAAGFVPASSPLFLEDLEPKTFEPERTLEIFRDNGWNETFNNGIIEHNGSKYSFEMIIPNTFMHLDKVLSTIRLNLNEIRIEAKYRPLPVEQYWEKIRNKDFIIALHYSYFFENDISNILKSFMNPVNADYNQNIFNLHNREIIRNINIMNQLEDFNRVKPIFERIQMLMDNEAVYLPLFFETTVYFALKTDKFIHADTFEKWKIR
ncbi:ABC transporter substrate-binding protein [candidate division KSB1 bacterium]